VIALLGNLSQDLRPGRPPHVGGGPYHGARALKRLGAPAAVVARVGRSERESLVPQIDELGVPAQFVSGEGTPTFSFTYDGDVRRMTVEALGDAWQPGDLPELPDGTWVHVAPLSRHEFPAATIAELAKTRRVSFDGQGLVRVPQVGPLRLDADFDPELLRHVHVLKLAEEEAEVLGEPTALGVPEVLLTQGGRGSTVYADGAVEFVPANNIPVDPTGAGDAYMTTYVMAREAGVAPGEAARRATALVEALLTG
jgi:sugar/nucleoside kinase (ribokinase family)